MARTLELEDPGLEILGPDAAGELLTLQRAAYVKEAAAHDDFCLPPLTQTLTEVQAELADAAVLTLGIRDGARLIASVRLRRSGEVMGLNRLVVAPDRQGQGLGSRLLRAAESVARGCSEIRLFTGEYSTDNIRLYERFGYRETGRSPAGRYDLVHFAKSPEA
jgi:GNAT superfamily N-acetyltransferase